MQFTTSYATGTLTEIRNIIKVGKGILAIVIQGTKINNKNTSKLFTLPACFIHVCS